MKIMTFLEYLERAFVPPSLEGPRPAGSPPQFSPEIPLSGNEPTPKGWSITDLRDPRVIDDINNHLERRLDCKFLTPYIALEQARKVLHPYGIVIQQSAYLPGDEGEYVFPIFQWGGIYGTKGTASVDTNMEANPDLNVYLSWSYNAAESQYDIFAAIVGLEELADLMDTDFDGTTLDVNEAKLESHLFHKIQHGSWGSTHIGTVKIRAASKRDAVAKASQKNRHLRNGDKVHYRHDDEHKEFEASKEQK